MWVDAQVCRVCGALKIAKEKKKRTGKRVGTLYLCKALSIGPLERTLERTFTRRCWLAQILVPSLKNRSDHGEPLASFELPCEVSYAGLETLCAVLRQSRKSEDLWPPVLRWGEECTAGKARAAAE